GVPEVWVGSGRAKRERIAEGHYRAALVAPACDEEGERAYTVEVVWRNPYDEAADTLSESASWTVLCEACQGCALVPGAECRDARDCADDERCEDEGCFCALDCALEVNRD